MQAQFSPDYILEEKSVKTANFMDPNPSHHSGEDLECQYTSNFAYHIMQQIQNPASTGGLPYIKYLLDFVFVNRSIPSAQLLNQSARAMLDLQESFFVSLDFDRFNNKVLLLVKIAHDYCLINYSLSDRKELFYTIKTNELLLFEAKYYSPYNVGSVVIVGTDHAFLIDLYDFDVIGPSIIDLNNAASSRNADIPYNVPQLKKIFAVKNATSVAISKGNCFLLFHSPFSRLIHVHDHASSETKSIRLSHYIDKVVFSQTNSEIVLLIDSKKSKKMLTILNLKKGYSQTLDVSSSKIKRECQYRNIKYLANDDITASLAGRADKLVIIKHGCLMIYENANYDLNFFDLTVGPMNYKPKSTINIIDKLMNEGDVYSDQPISIETCPNNEAVSIFTGKFKNRQFTFYFCTYNINTNNLFRHVVSENLQDSSMGDEYIVLSRLGDYPLVSISNIYNKK